MKKLADNLEEAGKEFRADQWVARQCAWPRVVALLCSTARPGTHAPPPPFPLPRYLVLFLKFIASVVPTISYDYTMSVGGD